MGRPSEWTERGECTLRFRGAEHSATVLRLQGVTHGPDLLSLSTRGEMDVWGASFAFDLASAPDYAFRPAAEGLLLPGLPERSAGSRDARFTMADVDVVECPAFEELDVLAIPNGAVFVLAGLALYDELACDEEFVLDAGTHTLGAEAPAGNSATNTANIEESCMPRARFDVAMATLDRGCAADDTFCSTE